MKPEALLGPKPAKYAQRYTDDEKASALELYVEVGPSEAARRTGIAQPTISNWARVAGLQEQVAWARAGHVLAVKQKWEERRAVIAEKVGDLAEEALEASRDAVAIGDSRAARDFGSTMATAIDKAQLLTGGPTERIGVEERFSERENEIELARAKAREVASQGALGPAIPVASAGSGSDPDDEDPDA